MRKEVVLYQILKFGDNGYQQFLRNDTLLLFDPYDRENGIRRSFGWQAASWRAGNWHPLLPVEPGRNLDTIVALVEARTGATLTIRGLPPKMQPFLPQTYPVNREGRALELARDLSLPQYLIDFGDVLSLPFTTKDYSLIEVFRVGRDVILSTEEVVTIAGFSNCAKYRYLITWKWGKEQDMMPDGIARNNCGNRDFRPVAYKYVRGVLVDRQQLETLFPSIGYVSYRQLPSNSLAYGPGNWHRRQRKGSSANGKEAISDILPRLKVVGFWGQHRQPH